MNRWIETKIGPPQDSGCLEFSDGECYIEYSVPMTEMSFEYIVSSPKSGAKTWIGTGGPYTAGTWSHWGNTTIQHFEWPKEKSPFQNLKIWYNKPPRESKVKGPLVKGKTKRKGRWFDHGYGDYVGRQKSTLIEKYNNLKS